MRDRTWRHSRRTDRPRLGRLAALILALCLPFARAEASPLKADEEVILFPTVAHLSADAKHWRVPIHAWVFEPECDSLLRNGLLAAAAAALGLEPTAVESAVLEQRLAWFLVDNEGGKRIDLTLSPESRNLGPTGANGHLLSEIELEPRGGETAWLEYAVDPPQGDRRVFTGQTLLLPDEGLSVVSDIDDTVKVSHVADKKALLENTFLKPFLPAPGMAALYRAMARKGAAFHYVSSSPWQLYPPLREFFEQVDLPEGSFHLGYFRIKDESFFNLFESSRATKPPTIEALMAAFPKRKFILIGDSGEADPEIYWDIARRHPDQVRAIAIRNVTGERADAPRFLEEAFQGLPPDLWLLFDQAEAASAFLASRF